MVDYAQTLLEIVNHVISKCPPLAEHIERMAANAQGKGFGTASIEQEVNCMRHLLKDEPALAIDVGGNVGNYTAKLREKIPDLEIHVFEPCTKNIFKIKQRFNGDPKIKIVPYALSDKSGSATLFSDEPGSGLGSLAQRRLTHFNMSFETRETVKTLRFDEYWKAELQSRQIDMVKIDIEGYELFALNGFGKALKATKVLQFEFGGCNIDTRTFFQDFWYFFKENGFDLYRISPFGTEKLSHYKESGEFFSTTNYIAVNRLFS
jgi:FkbM family methyltransferase